MLKEKNQGDEAMLQILARAEKNMQQVAPRIWESAQKAFKTKDGHAKIPATKNGETPHFYMSQGGMGSGKSYAENIALSESGANLVVAGLDGVRRESQQYNLYMATENHNDDYKKFEEFGKLIRALTVRRAQAEGYHILLDGTGVPYEGRYDKVVKSFKQQGYHTSVLAADVPLYVANPEMRHQLAFKNQTFDDALYRGGSRLAMTGRAVPLNLVSESHFRAPEAIMNAARDPNVDRFRLLDTAPSPENAYTLSYTANITKDQLRTFRGKNGKELQHALQAEGLEPKDTRPPADASHYQHKIIARSGDTYRMQVITNIDRHLAMVEKSLYNRKVKTWLEKKETTGPEDYTINTLAFDVEGKLQDPNGKLKTHPVTQVGIAQWPQHSHAMSL